MGREKFNLGSYCNWLREHVAKSERASEVSQISFGAIDSFEKVMKSRAFSENGIRDIVLAAKSRRLGPYYIGTELLLELSKEFPDVEKIWRDLIESPLAHERWVAISAVRDERTAFNFSLELVQKAINDKSSRVRLFAIECVHIRCLYSLLPEVKKRAEVENNKKVLHTIEWVVSNMNY